MESKQTDNFDKIEYLRNYISAFLQSESKGLNAVTGALNALKTQSGASNAEIDAQRKKILEAFFSNQKILAIIQREKQKRRNITSRKCHKYKPRRKSRKNL